MLSIREAPRDLPHEEFDLLVKKMTGKIRASYITKYTSMLSIQEAPRILVYLVSIRVAPRILVFLVYGRLRETSRTRSLTCWSKR